MHSFFTAKEMWRGINLVPEEPVQFMAQSSSRKCFCSVTSQLLVKLQLLSGMQANTHLVDFLLLLSSLLGPVLSMLGRTGASFSIQPLTWAFLME